MGGDIRHLPEKSKTAGERRHRAGTGEADEGITTRIKPLSRSKPAERRRAGASKCSDFIELSLLRESFPHLKNRKRPEEDDTDPGLGK
jgi:hypothetical protein